MVETTTLTLTSVAVGVTVGVYLTVAYRALDRLEVGWIGIDRVERLLAEVVRFVAVLVPSSLFFWATLNTDRIAAVPGLAGWIATAIVVAAVEHTWLGGGGSADAG